MALKTLIIFNNLIIKMVETEEQEQKPTEVESAQPGLPRAYMIMFNIAKKNNFGTIIRSAAAFGLEEVFFVDAVGKRSKINTFGS